MDLNHASQKRRREFEDCDDGAKKACRQGEKFDKPQTPKPTFGNSLSTPLASQPLSGHSSVLAMSPKTPESHLCTELACGELTYLELSTTFKPTQLSCTSLSPNSCIKKQPSMGAKQAYVNSYQNHTVKITESSNPSEECMKKRSEEINKGDKSSSLLSSEVLQKVTASSPHFQSGSHNSSHIHRNTSVLSAKTLSRDNQVEESRKFDSGTPKPASKPNSGSLSCCTTERNRTVRPRKPIAIPDNIDELFTPDPVTCVIPANKTAKPKINGETIKSSTTENRCLSRTVNSSSNAVTGSLCHKAQNFTVTGSPHAVDTKVSSFSSASHPQISLPTVTLERVKLKNLRSLRPPDSKLKNSPEATSSSTLLKDEGVKSDEKQMSLLLNNVRPCTLETDITASQKTSISHCLKSPLLERQASDGGKKQVNEEDPIDVELDLGLSFALDLDLSQSSHSSEEEQLLSLQEMMERATKPSDTPEKGAFSEPSTPGHHSFQSKTVSSSWLVFIVHKVTNV